MKTAIYRNEDTPDFACLFVAQTPNDACYSAFSSPNDQPGYATFPAKKPEINHLIWIQYVNVYTDHNQNSASRLRHALPLQPGYSVNKFDYIVDHHALHLTQNEQLQDSEFILTGTLQQLAKLLFW